GENIDEDLVNKVFRAVHSIKGGAGFLGLDTVKELAHSSENVMGKIRSKELIPTSDIISSLLDAIDTLSTLIKRYETSNEADISVNMAALSAIYAGQPLPASPALKDVVPAPPAAETPLAGGKPGQVSSSANGLVLRIEKAQIEAAFDTGMQVFIVSYDLSKGGEALSENCKGIIDTLKDCGDIIAANIDIDSVLSPELLKETENQLIVVISSMLEKELLASFVNIDLEQIEQISAEDLALAATPCAAPTMAEPTVKPPPTDGLPEKPAMPPAVEPEKKQKAVDPAPPGKESPVKAEIKPDTSLRVSVRQLDNLMTLAGELVLTRNQLVQSVSSRKLTDVDNISQRLNLVTSELQEAIMSTRMQPIGNVFNKFKRIVRDLSKGLGKKIDLMIEGEEVELDKTIIESIGDPLTHLVRNSVDHGVELPVDRVAAGKQETGTLRITAYHEGGQVMIAIEDDGAGINIGRVKEKVLSMGLYDAATLETMSDKEIAKLIFLPGMSTAKVVSDVSGRGVGMDVVNTNISKVGGIVDIDTTPGKGSLITIKLPLTLAIIPSLMVAVHDERYAIPQVNMVELVRIPAAKVKERIEKIGRALVMRLRGELLPLVKLSEALGINDCYYTSTQTNELLPEKRVRTEDRRKKDYLKVTATEVSSEIVEDEEKRAQENDRRTSPLSAYNILVVSAGAYHYGLIVDQLLDSEEIVVKPLGTHLRDCKCYAGASVQGDGRVALILDVVGISNIMNLRTVSNSVQEQALQRAELKVMQDVQSLLIVRNAPKEQIAIPLDLVSRIELSKTADIEITGGRRNIQYRGTTLPLFTIDEVAKVGSISPDSQICYIIVFSINGKEVGIIMSEIIDIIRGDYAIDEITHKQPGILGSSIINDEITLLVDLYGIIDTLIPEWTQSLKSKTKETGPATILVVEDSPFFLNQFVNFLKEAGHKPLTATDGLQGLEVLDTEQVDMVVTDIEMPNMDGLEMTRKIRDQERFKNLPVIAVTSLAGDAAEKKGKLAGIDEYLIKLDREKLIASIKKHLGKK
nr:chemotaxis protein CheW [Desulfobulbaceae bacterium]